MQRVMLILFYVLVAPLVCIIQAAPLCNSTEPLNTSEVIYNEALNGEWTQFSPYVTFAIQAPIIQPPVFNAQSWYAACDSQTRWVTDKHLAIDIGGRQVMVLSEIQTRGAMLKQYFFETSCKPSSHTTHSCRGVDQRYWNSKCDTKQTYVRALTVESDVVAWRWIKIDTACVCTLIRRPDQIYE